jgi:K+-sensing histidine kinase KdpD
MYRINAYSRIFLQYFFATLTFAITTGILYALRDYLETPLIALLFLLPVGINTAFWGLGPGILSALSAFLGLNYFFIKPY